MRWLFALFPSLRLESSTVDAAVLLRKELEGLGVRLPSDDIDTNRDPAVPGGCALPRDMEVVPPWAWLRRVIDLMLGNGNAPTGVIELRPLGVFIGLPLPAPLMLSPGGTPLASASPGTAVSRGCNQPPAGMSRYVFARFLGYGWAAPLPTAVLFAARVFLVLLFFMGYWAA